MIEYIYIMDQRLRYVIIALGVILLGFMVYYFSNIVAYILIAAVLSLVGRPLVRKLGEVKIKGFRMGKGAAAFLTLLTLWLALLSFFGFLIPLVVSEVNQLSSINIPEVVSYMEKAIDQLGQEYPHLMPQLPGNGELQPYLETQLTSLLNIGHVSDLFSAVASVAGNIFLMFFSVSFILFFFLKDEDLFGNWILVLVPVKVEERVSKVMNSITNLLKRYLIGMLLEVFGVMIVSIIGFTIVGMGFSHAVVVGVFAGLLNVIPYIGPWIGGLFGLVVVVANHLNDNFNEVTLPLLILVIIVVAVVQFIDNWFFQPVIYSSSVKAHPLEVFFVILMAGSIAGIPGMILGIPVYTVLRTIAGEFLSEFKVVRQLTAQTRPVED